MRLTEEARRERKLATRRAWYAKHQQQTLDKVHARRDSARAAKAANPAAKAKTARVKVDTAWHERYILKAPTGYCSCAVGQYCPHLPSQGEGLRSPGVRPDWTRRQPEEAA